MASRPMSHWDESTLFGEGYLSKRTARPTKVVESASISEEQERPNTMENRLSRPTCIHGAPPLWRCNVRKEHRPEEVVCHDLIDKAPQIRPCLCVECMLKKYPYLEEGPPFITKEEMRERLEADYVGLYEPEEYTELRPPCAVCGKPIKIDGKTAAKFQKNEEDIIHVACLSDADFRALHTLVGGVYALPYIIRAQRKQEQEKCDGREEDDGPDDGGGTSGT